MFFIYCGVLIASGDVMYSKTKKEIIESFIADAKGMIMKEIKKITAFRLLFIISTKSLGRLILGGVTAALGACFMHYIGMLAMEFPGEVVWRPEMVFVSCLIAAVAGTAAFLILFRLLSLFPDLEVLRLASALLMAIAVSAMHYTGMSAAQFRYDPTRFSITLGDSHADEEIAFYGALVASNVFLWLMIIALLADTRKLMNEKNRNLNEADNLIKRMAEENVNNKSPIISIRTYLIVPFLAHVKVRLINQSDMLVLLLLIMAKRNQQLLRQQQLHRILSAALCKIVSHHSLV